MSIYKPNAHVKPSDDLHHGSIQVFDKVWKDFLINFKNKFKGDVLDVGCGDGFITQYCQEKLFNQGVKMSGCDLSEKMVEFCKEQRPGLDFFQLDITVDIDENLVKKYDGVFCNMLLHMIPQPKKSLEILFKLLNIDGFFFCCFFSHLFIYETYKELMQQGHPEWSKYLQDYEKFRTPFQDLNEQESEKKFQEMMADVGFQNIHPKTVKVDVVVASLDQFKGVIRSADPFYPRIEQPKAEKFLDDLIEIWIEKKELLPVDPKKPIREHPELPVYSRMTVLAATAEKI